MRVSSSIFSDTTHTSSSFSRNRCCLSLSLHPPIDALPLLLHITSPKSPSVKLLSSLMSLQIKSNAKKKKNSLCIPLDGTNVRSLPQVGLIHHFTEGNCSVEKRLSEEGTQLVRRSENRPFASGIRDHGSLPNKFNPRPHGLRARKLLGRLTTKSSIGKMHTEKGGRIENILL